MIKDKNIIYKDTEYMEIVKDIISNEMVLKMKQYRQHFDITCFDHCLFVSYNMYIICKKHNLDYKSAARAGLVHDLFLYDWRKREEGRKGFHAFTHPRASYENAKKIFTPNKIEKDIILKHMWPVTPKFPRYKESFLITYVDKYFACIEKSLSNNSYNNFQVLNINTKETVQKQG